MPVLTIDHHPVSVPDGSTILDAAVAAGVAIPTICFRGGCSASTSCMVCVVKLHGRANFVPACSMPAEDGMEVESETPEVFAARRTALELLLSDHAGDCEAPCRFLCPAGINIPEMLRAIGRNAWEESLEIIRRDTPLAAVLGYTCSRPCEKGCRRGIADKSVDICTLKRNVAVWGLESNIPDSRPPAEPREETVAVIGAGPAGITAAYFLRRWGFQVTIFEKASHAGGRLRTEYETQLPAYILRRELQFALPEGIPEFQVNYDSPVEDEETFYDLTSDFGAVLIAAPQDFLKEKLTSQRKSCATRLPNVFAAGSGVIAESSGKKPIIRSVAEGRDAAESIRQFLAHRQPEGKEAFYSVRLGKPTKDEMDSLLGSRRPPSGGELPNDNPLRFSAATEAARCLHCDCRAAETCRLRIHAREYHADAKRFSAETPRRENLVDARHTKILFESGKCIACGLCIQSGLAWFGRGYDVRVGIPFADLPEDAIPPDLLEECVRRCPTAAIAWR